jgi:transglycosylase-like protein with SLT domain/sporulation related protein
MRLRTFIFGRHAGRRRIGYPGSRAMKLRGYFFILLHLILLHGTRIAAAEGDAPDPAVPPDREIAPPAEARESVCLMIESAARANALPLDFFARVIWQESRFQPDVVGPLTRSGERAQGIAQFMPGTAAERGLLDPFDPVEALPKSAAFLAELRNQFGNLGLAAAAYNAGPQRVRDFIRGARGLPAETRKYVLAVTGRAVEDWANGARSGTANERQTSPTGTASGNCHDLVALLKQTPNPFVEELQQRINQVAISPWGVELSAGFSRDRVLTAYAGLLKRFGEILSGHDPSILSGTFRSRGAHLFYQVRVGAETREAANTLCSQIHRGGGACLVLRNTGRVPSAG